MWTLGSGAFLGWSLGANDSANIFGTSVMTGLIKYRTAILLTAVFVIVGALLEGPKCMRVMNDLSRIPAGYVFFCTLAAALTMTALTVLGIPASTSQAIVGAVLGAGIVTGNADFSKLYKIVSCWVLTPVAGLVLGYLLHHLLGFLLNRTVTGVAARNMLFTAGVLVFGCYASYCLGANNVANVTGIYVGSGLLTPQQASSWGGAFIAVGVLTYSRRVMLTVGKGIVPLDPFSALVCLLAEALTLHLFTQIGVPVSSSQAVVGAVVGVGLVSDLKTVNPRMLLKIFMGWVLTPVSAGVVTVVFLKLLV